MSGVKSTAIVLAAGQGKRMNSSVQKQYLLLKDRPVIYYSLKAFEESEVTDIVLVTGESEIDYCQREIVERYGISKGRWVTAGGSERDHSVANGLSAICWECGYVFIHDGARPLIDADIIGRAFDAVRESAACIVGMPVKDTIKLSDENGYVGSTPDRSRVWQVQTPQAFEYGLITKAYKKLIADEKALEVENIAITDDAMAVEHFGGVPVKLVEGSYKNIKITTPEDLKIAEALLEKM